MMDVSTMEDEIKSIVGCMERLIARDEGGRGMTSLVVPGDLFRAAQTLASLPSSSNSHVIILSGFPCRVQHSPPTETDGPPGSCAIARAVRLGLGCKVTLVTDDCNEAVFAAAIANDNLELVTFPDEISMTERQQNQMKQLATNCDLIIACERAGPGMDGHCYTASGIDMTKLGLIAPLHTLVDHARQTNKTRFIGIGDGGNELGMGKVYDAVCSNINNGELVACVTRADYLIAASVSNWGGYALAAATALIYSSHDKKHLNEELLNKFVPTEEEEVALLNRIVSAGCRDGISGSMEATVDGMPLETSMKCLRNLRHLVLETRERSGMQ